MTSATPIPVSLRPERSPFVAIDVDADLPATISRVKIHQSFLTTTFGAVDTAKMLAREVETRNERRVDLLTKRLMGQLTAAESHELSRLQASEGERFGRKLQARNLQLRKLLEA